MARREKDRSLSDEVSEAWRSAIRRDDAAEARRLAARPPGARAIVRDPEGDFPALILATMHRAEAVACALINAGAELNGVPDALSVALHSGAPGVAQALLAAGARLAVPLEVPSGPQSVFYPAVGCAGAGNSGQALLEGLIVPARDQGVDVGAMLNAVAREALREDDAWTLSEAGRLGADLAQRALLADAVALRAPRVLDALLDLATFSHADFVAATPAVIHNNEHACENIKVLLRRGVGLKAFGEAALVDGCWYDRGGGRPAIDAFELLLRGGVSANARGGEPLRGAVLCQAPDWELAGLLLRHGADPKVLPPEAQQALRLSCKGMKP